MYFLKFLIHWYIHKRQFYWKCTKCQHCYQATTYQRIYDYCVTCVTWLWRSVMWHSQNGGTHVMNLNCILQSHLLFTKSENCLSFNSPHCFRLYRQNLLSQSFHISHVDWSCWGHDSYTCTYWVYSVKVTRVTFVKKQ